MATASPVPSWVNRLYYQAEEDAWYLDMGEIVESGTDLQHRCVPVSKMELLPIETRFLHVKGFNDGGPSVVLNTAELTIDGVSDRLGNLDNHELIELMFAIRNFQFLQRKVRIAA